MTLGWGQLGTGLRGLHCQNGQQQGKPLPQAQPSLPLPRWASLARGLRSWTPCPKPHADSGPRCASPTGRRARTGCGAAAVGATPEEGSVWPTSCFRPSENPEGTWQPVWVADESGLGGWPVRREPLAGRLGHRSLPLGPLSGPQATRGDCLSPPNREPWAGCWPQGPWPWGTLFLFAPHLPECQTPRPAQRSLERIRVPETCGPLLGGGVLHSTPETLYYGQGPGGDPAHLHPPPAAGVRSGLVPSTRLAPQTPRVTENLVPRASRPRPQTCPVCRASGTTGAEALATSAAATPPPCSPPGHQACARPCTPCHCLAQALPRPEALTKPCPPPPARRPLTSAGHQARAPQEASPEPCPGWGLGLSPAARDGLTDTVSWLRYPERLPEP